MPRKAKTQYDNFRSMPKGMRKILGRAKRINAKARSTKSAKYPLAIPGPRCITRTSGLYERHQRGGWRKAGKYLAQNKPGMDDTPWKVFDASGAVDNPRERVSEWWDAGDDHLQKIILSPDAAKEIDLELFTRDLMKQLEPMMPYWAGTPQGAKLEWMAAEHHDEEHPHVHVLLRTRAGGKQFRLSLEFRHSVLRREASLAIAKQLGIEQKLDVGLQQNAATQKRSMFA